MAIIIEESCTTALLKLKKSSIDLVVTSPPYDDLRSYETNSKGEGWSHAVFLEVVKGLTHAVKLGGVVIWNVNDKTANGSESGTSFRQVLSFMEAGWLLSDTMIWEKTCSGALGSNRVYLQNFEYMFVLSNGKSHEVFNPLRDRPNVATAGKKIKVNQNLEEGKATSHREITTTAFGKRTNIWRISQQQNSWHPAPFPYKLVHDHILSWSNEGDTVLDPFAGSGTTLKAAEDLNRKAIGIEMSTSYAQKLREIFK